MPTIFLGMIMDKFIGDPRSWPHPVIYIGKWISWIEKKTYGKSKIRGGFLAVSVLGMIAFCVLILEKLFTFSEIAYHLFMIYGYFSGLAYKSLLDASHRVYQSLEKEGLEAGRTSVSYIVGRDTSQLSKEEVIKATVETLAENSIDGIVAPLFYAVLGQALFGQGLLWIWLYKGINTMDSMVGYQNEKYGQYGYIPAKLDDLANFLPARLGSLFLMISNMFSYSILDGYRIWKRDRLNHKSPNSAHGESIVAGFLGIQLGGSHEYFGQVVEKPTIGDKLRVAQVKDIKETERMISRLFVLLFIMVGISLLSMWIGSGEKYGI